jgi:predicted transcriptional regulator
MARGSATSDATDAELAVMRALWAGGASEQARGPKTIRELTDQLYPGGKASEYATVQKLLERLEQKGLVRRIATAVPHRFTPLIGVDDLIGRRLRGVADKLCGGSMTPLLTHLVRGRSLKKYEIDALRSLIDQLDRPRSPRTK